MGQRVSKVLTMVNSGLGLFLRICDFMLDKRTVKGLEMDSLQNWASRFLANAAPALPDYEF